MSERRHSRNSLQRKSRALPRRLSLDTKMRRQDLKNTLFILYTQISIKSMCKLKINIIISIRCKNGSKKVSTISGSIKVQQVSDKIQGNNKKTMLPIARLVVSVGITVFEVESFRENIDIQLLKIPSNSSSFSCSLKSTRKPDFSCGCRYICSDHLVGQY